MKLLDAVVRTKTVDHGQLPVAGPLTEGQREFPPLPGRKPSPNGRGCLQNIFMVIDGVIKIYWVNRAPLKRAPFQGTCNVPVIGVPC